MIQKMLNKKVVRLSINVELFILINDSYKLDSVDFFLFPGILSILSGTCSKNKQHGF